jgi:hypothetical protein
MTDKQRAKSAVKSIERDGRPVGTRRNGDFADETRESLSSYLSWFLV